MGTEFFDHPILNSPYEYPNRHWELDKSGQPTQKVVESRRRAEFITPIPKPRKVKKKKDAETQHEIVFDDAPENSGECEGDQLALAPWALQHCARRLEADRVTQPGLHHQGNG
jgi:hypothetical protein